MATNWRFTGTSNARWLWADTPWLSQVGPGRVEPNGAMRTSDAVCMLHRACPGIRIGYNGDPAAWQALPPGGTYPDDLLTARASARSPR